MNQNLQDPDYKKFVLDPAGVGSLANLEQESDMITLMFKKAAGSCMMDGVGDDWSRYSSGTHSQHSSSGCRHLSPPVLPLQSNLKMSM